MTENKRYSCNKCGGTGKTPYTHIMGGVCFKCEGRGSLPYNPDRSNGVTSEQPEPDYDSYTQAREREFWRNYDNAQDEVDAQRFFEENGFEVQS